MNKKTNTEYLETIKKISEILRTQSYDGNTDMIPTYWMIEKKKRIWNVDKNASDGCECAWVYEWENTGDTYDFETFKGLVAERIKELPIDDDEQIEAVDKIVNAVKNSSNIDDLIEAIENLRYEVDLYSYDWEIKVFYYREEWRDIPNKMFLTKRDAKSYIENFGYRYREHEKPLRTYAYVAENSPDLTALIDALKNIDWDNVKVKQPVNKDNKSPNRILLRITDRNGEKFGLMAPVGVSKSKIVTWLNSVLSDNVSWDFEQVDGILDSEYSRHLVMYPDTDYKFDIFMPSDFWDNTDDGIFFWVTNYFKSTNYNIV